MQMTTPRWVPGAPPPQQLADSARESRADVRKYTPWGIMEGMIPHVSVSELKRAIDDGVGQVIDVRENWEFHEAHLPGSTLIPMQTVPDNTHHFSHEGPTFVICRSGNRSGHVVAWLINNGIDAINVAGGIVEWQQNGYPVNTGGQQ